MLIEDLEDTDVKSMVWHVSLCGSRVTCNPPVLDTDVDVLVHVRYTRQEALKEKLLSMGYVIEGAESDYPEDDSAFKSYRKGNVNLIVSPSGEFVRRHRMATAVCTGLNLMLKSDRIKVFNICLYGDLLI